MPATIVTSNDLSLPSPRPLVHYRWILLLTLIGSLCGLSMAIAPVHHIDKSFQWNPASSTAPASVVAPLTTMTAQSMEIDIPLSVLHAHQGGYFLSTIAQDTSPQTISTDNDADTNIDNDTDTTQSSLFNRTGLIVYSSPAGISVVSRGVSVFMASWKELSTQLFSRLPSQLHIDTHTGGIYAHVTHSHLDSLAFAQQHYQRFGPELKPQVTGIFTPYSASTLPGVHAHVVIDNRFDIYPTGIKKLLLGFTILCIIAVLTCLYGNYLPVTLSSNSISLLKVHVLCTMLMHKLEHGVQTICAHYRTHRFKALLDLGVAIVLLSWWCVGPAGYGDGVYYEQVMNSLGHANVIEYYRFFGVSTAPFTWYPHFLALLASWCADPLFLRFPACILGICSWLVIHYGFLPVITKTSLHPLSIYCGGALFLGLWMYLDNGLRPEPYIVFLLLMSWLLLAYARQNYHPLRVYAALLGCGLALCSSIVGIVALAIIIAFVRPLVTMWVLEWKKNSYHPLVAFLLLCTPPLLALTSLWVLEFSSDTLATMAEAIRVKLHIGPITPWTQEYLRYYFLAEGADASLALRAPLVLFIVLLLMGFFLLSRAQSRSSLLVENAMRVVSTVFFMFALLVFTPNKWAAELGVFTGFAAVIAIITVELVIGSYQLKIRNTLIFWTTIIFGLSYAVAAKNMWPSYGVLGIPWFNVRPLIFGTAVANIGLLCTILIALAALLSHYSAVLTRQTHARQGQPAVKINRKSGQRFMQRKVALPLAVILSLIPGFDFSIFAKASLSRSHSFTVMRSNLARFTGDGCALGNYIYVEPDPTRDILAPHENISPTQALSGDDQHNVGFSPNAIPQTITDQTDIIAQGHMYTAVRGQATYVAIGSYPGTNGGTVGAGVNGSHAYLPFTLSPKQVPVLGSYMYPATAQLTTSWYTLPAFRADRPLLAIAMAGTIFSQDKHKKTHFGQSVTVEFGIDKKDGSHPDSIVSLATLTPIDALPGSAWRDVRIDLSQVKKANVVRIHIVDTNLRTDQWVALTPPRVPQLTPLATVIGHDRTIKDLAVAEQFPCIASAHNYGGVWQLPQWRIAPPLKEMNTSSQTWQKALDGGTLGIIEAVMKQNTLPTFMRGDLYTDWGALITLHPQVIAHDPVIVSQNKTEWGWHRTGPIRAFGGNDESRR